MKIKILKKLKKKWLGSASSDPVVQIGLFLVAVALAFAIKSVKWWALIIVFGLALALMIYITLKYVFVQEMIV